MKAIFHTTYSDSLIICSLRAIKFKKVKKNKYFIYIK